VSAGVADDAGRGLPSDRALTETGLAPARAGRVLLIACGALAREILDLKAANGWDHLDLTCLPANLHLRPERITAAVEAAVLKHRDDYQGIFVVYADCGTGGLRDMYFGNYQKLVYQAQTDDPALDEKARDCAARLGLDYERRLTGYGDLTGVLARL